MMSPSRVPLLVVVAFAFAAPSAREVVAQAAEQTSEQTGAGGARLFQSFFSDAIITGSPYWGGALSARDYGGGSALQFDAFAGYTFSPQLEIQGRLGYLRSSPSEGDSRSGLTDPFVTGQYLFNDLRFNDAGDVMDIGVGGYVDLPTGKAEVGGNTLDLGVFSALRYRLNSGVILTGNFGLDFLKAPALFIPGICIPAIYLPVCTSGQISNSRVTSMSIGGGAVYPATDDLQLVGEFRMESKFDYAALSGGVDYATTIGRLRGALVVGLDDGAPDVALAVQLLRSF